MEGAQDPRTDRTRAAIRQATLEIMQVHGAGGVTHRRVAEVAGLGRATVYRYYPSPAVLVEEVLTTSGPLGLPRAGEGPLREQLIAALAALAAEARDPGAGAVMTTVLDRARQPGSARVLRDRFVAEILGELEELLDRSVAAGEVRGRPDARMLLDLLAGPVWHRILVQGGTVDDDFLTEVVDTALAPWHP